MDKIKILALYGKSSAGKDTLQKLLCEDLPMFTAPIISCTTRPPRDCETDGVDYHFITEQEFREKEKNGFILESTEFRGWHYGTLYSSLDSEKINVGVFNIQGIKTIMQNDNLLVCPVRIAASDKLRLMRSLAREHNPDCVEICRRFLADEADFNAPDAPIPEFILVNNFEQIHYYPWFVEIYAWFQDKTRQSY